MTPVSLQTELLPYLPKLSSPPRNQGTPPSAHWASWVPGSRLHVSEVILCLLESVILHLLTRFYSCYIRLRRKPASQLNALEIRILHEKDFFFFLNENKHFLTLF